MAKKYTFKIENQTHVWEDQFITGAQVRAIPPGIPENMDLFLKRKSSPGELVANEDKIDLSEKGIERFYSQQADSTPG